jgi:sugar phosphate isomerase/epimerase
MHDRISFNNLCFPGVPLEQDAATWRALGARRIGVTVAKLDAAGWEPGIAAVRATGLKVATMTHTFMVDWPLDQRSRWEEGRAKLMRTLGAAETLGAETVYMTTGGRGALDWEGAAQAFTEAVAPCAAEARSRGLRLLIETAPTLYADIHMAHTLRDTVKLAKQAGIGVCMDVFACWTESDLVDSIREAAPLTHLVQVSDYVPGDRSYPCRAVPGDGAIPLAAILRTILDCGYAGAFDLELIGPRIAAEGAPAAAARAAAWIERFLRDYEQSRTGRQAPLRQTPQRR